MTSALVQCVKTATFLSVCSFSVNRCMKKIDTTNHGSKNLKIEKQTHPENSGEGLTETGVETEVSDGVSGCALSMTYDDMNSASVKV